MQKKTEAPRPEEGPKKAFAGRSELAKLAPLTDEQPPLSDEKTRVYSIREISEAVVISARAGGLTREKAEDVLAALPKKI